MVLSYHHHDINGNNDIINNNNNDNGNNKIMIIINVDAVGEGHCPPVPALLSGSSLPGLARPAMTSGQIKGAEEYKDRVGARLMIPRFTDVSSAASRLLPVKEVMVG